jgi:triosephosphate isomerase
MFQTLGNCRPQGSSSPAAEGERKYLVAGNWKCNGSVAENEELIKILNEAGPIPSNCEVVCCAPFPYLAQLLSGLRDDIEVGGQDCGSNKDKGAFTGEVGAFMLKDLGCTWVIIGHSERREGFGMVGEPEELCAEKTKIALDAGLKVMFCIGEKKEERESGVTMDVCAKQLEPLVKVLAESEWQNIAIAYEPVWAIGTTKYTERNIAQLTSFILTQFLKCYRHRTNSDS